MVYCVLFLKLFIYDKKLNMVIVCIFLNKL